MVLDAFSFPFIIPWAVSLVAIIVGSWNDIRTREVPDWMNFSLLAFGITFGVLVSLIYWDYHPLLYSLTGLVICVAIAYFMYYTGQWGGGDAKLLMGLGAVIGFNPSIFSGFSIFRMSVLFDFIVNLILAGAVYGFFFVIILAFVKRKQFYPAFRMKAGKLRGLRYAAWAVGIFGVLSFFFLSPPFNYLTFALAAGLFFMFYLWIIAKTVEHTCMTKEVPIQALTEGDWILKDVIVSGKRITGPKDLGISKEQIAELLRLKKQKKISKIWIKIGIPFVPSFLFGFLITTFLPHWYLYFF
ncbi:MAG: A24 family peptidase [Nanoarchaeota archaeon]